MSLCFSKDTFDPMKWLIERTSAAAENMRDDVNLLTHRIEFPQRHIDEILNEVLEVSYAIGWRHSFDHDPRYGFAGDREEAVEWLQECERQAESKSLRHEVAVLLIKYLEKHPQRHE